MSSPPASAPVHGDPEMETCLPPPPGFNPPRTMTPASNEDDLLPTPDGAAPEATPPSTQSKQPSPTLTTEPTPTQPTQPAQPAQPLTRRPTVPPPPFPFSKSRPTKQFAFTAKPKSKNSRTAFLTAALSPSFVSAKPLHTRAHTTISEIVGNLAPERYLSLPPRSPAAAKALLATAVCKQLRDVRKLESIRTRHGDVEGGGWFDYVLDALDGGVKLGAVKGRLQELLIPAWEGIVDRVSFLPLECLNVGSVMGQDFSEMVKKKGEHLHVCKTRPVESAEVRIARMKNSIKAQIAKNGQQKKVVANVPRPLPVDDLDDDLLPPLPSGRPVVQVSTVAKTTVPVSKVPVNDIVMIDDDTPAQSNSEIPTLKPRVQLPVSLVFDDATGKVSIDWEIREIPPKRSTPVKPAATTPVPPRIPKPSAANTPSSKKRSTAARKTSEQPATPQPVPNPTAQIQAAAPAAQRLRYGGLSTNLATLLDEIDDDILLAPQPNKTPGSDPEIVVIDGAKETPAPKPAQRRTKRKRVERTQERAVETEQRASRMRSAVVSALQEDPEARRARAGRSSTANGHAKSKKTVSFSGRRMSRRSKKNVAPILDSSGSEKEYRRDQDDDFTIDVEDVIEVLPVPKANGTRLPAPDLSPPMARPPPPPLGREAPGGLTEIESLDGSDMVSPPIRTIDLRASKQSGKKASRSGASKQPRMHRSGASSSRRERRQVVDETHEGEPELWNREILQVQRLIEESEQDSDPLLNEIEYNPYRFYEQVPILRRVIKAAKAQHGHLMDMDKVDEYEEMDQFYKETRSDPPFGSGSACPATEFLEHIFQQTERERLQASTGYAGDPSNNAVDIINDETIDMPGPSKRAAGVVNLTAEVGQPSCPIQGSSESSSESSGEDDDMYAGGSKRSRSHMRSRASKARELQSRVCGDLLGTMTNEAKRRVLRWAERDFTWFDREVDVMEIVASRVHKRCPRCDSGEKEEAKCEESILLKLWKDMSWRKVRRMRHRSSGTN